jgi:hypothetical protein
MATHQHQAPAAQAQAEGIELPAKRSKRASTVRSRNEQWERRIEEDWQGHLETLRECISELLIVNRHPRMEPMKADRRSQQ